MTVAGPIPAAVLNGLILAAVVAAAIVLMLPRIARATRWQATVTPLASIIGSGFLVLGPLLCVSYGAWAPLVMAGLCAVSYAFGGAIRFNIATLDRDARVRSRLEDGLETLASWALAFAYAISVAYYLNLFGAFGVSLTPVNDDVHAKLLTSAIYVIVVAVGWFWGFKALERMEQASVSAKLAIIAGLLVGLALFFGEKADTDTLVLNPPSLTGWAGVTLAFGLIITVQGFETSRYLGYTYDAPMRIGSMRLAQWIATAIYMTYMLLLGYVFGAGELKLDETAIIDMMARVAPVLPMLLVAAALSAQFSAAIADTGGSGGLIEELTRNRVSPRLAYALLSGIGLVMTWTLHVFEIIAYASRAFAFYYALQALIAASTAWREKRGRVRAAGFAALAVFGFVILLFGTAAEA
ncbi:MAG: hypothetical protein KDJ77_12385 [Rhodobiaceae bacterium]|nr:hypothetical protein [Rhodobiaceae bacterium]